MKVSVITATWNSGKTLRTTLDSVLNQSYPDIEHIIVDGGSTDNTMEIIREYEPRYNGRLRYISEPDTRSGPMVISGGWKRWMALINIG